MRTIELEHSEVLNATEVILIFSTTYRNKPYGTYVTLNMASSPELQDEQILGALERLLTFTEKDAKRAI
jgi:hypothetical protein